MSKLVENLRNIFKIEELRDRVLFTIALLAVVRIGAHITLVIPFSSAFFASASPTTLLTSVLVLQFLTSSLISFDKLDIATSVCPFVSSIICA